MTLNELTAAVVDGLRTMFTEVKQVEAYSGQLNAGSSSRISVAPPAIFVAVLSARYLSDPGTGEIEMAVKVVAYVITNSARTRNARNVDAVTLADLMIIGVHGNRWGQPENVEPAKVERAENLASARFDDKGLAVWAVTWEQVIRLGINEWDGVGVIPTELYVGLVPLTGPDNVADYEQVLG